jgi:hypothetical protein
MGFISAYSDNTSGRTHERMGVPARSPARPGAACPRVSRNVPRSGKTKLVIYVIFYFRVPLKTVISRSISQPVHSPSFIAMRALILGPTVGPVYIVGNQAEYYQCDDGI